MCVCVCVCVCVCIARSSRNWMSVRLPSCWRVWESETKVIWSEWISLSQHHFAYRVCVCVCVCVCEDKVMVGSRHAWEQLMNSDNKLTSRQSHQKFLCSSLSLSVSLSLSLSPSLCFSLSVHHQVSISPPFILYSSIITGKKEGRNEMGQKGFQGGTVWFRKGNPNSEW